MRSQCFRISAYVTERCAIDRPSTNRRAGGYVQITVAMFLTMLFLAGVLHAQNPAFHREAARIEWKANWVWPRIRDISPHSNQFIQFRKVFDVGETPSAARLAIFADSHYQVFVNGTLVGRGPARAPLYWGYYDTFSVKHLLRPGKNVIAVEVRWFNAPMGWYREPPGAPAHGGLLCQLEMTTRAGLDVVASDESWKTDEDTSMGWGEPAMNGSLPEIEVVHADRGNSAWIDAGFDDHAWFPAQITVTQFGVSRPPAEPFANLEQRPMAYPVEQRRNAVAIVSSGVSNGIAKPGVADAYSGTALLVEHALANYGHFIATEPHDNSVHVLKDPAALITEGSDGEATVLPHTSPAYVILDMGKEVDGYPHLQLEAPKGVVVDLAWSERLSGGHVVADEPGGNYVARYYTRSGPQDWTLWGWHGLRFLELRFSPSDVPIRFHADVIFSTADMLHDGSLQTSDPELNELWQMGAYTWQLCALDGAMDCPTREQREWVGDGELELLVNAVADGNYDIARKFLLDVARDQRQDGAIPSVAASGVSDVWVIDDYMFSFINAAYEYYLESNDKEFLARIYPNIVRTMQWFDRHRQPDGYLGTMPYWVFLDWSMPDQKGESSILNALYAHTLKNAAELAGVMNDTRSKGQWTEGARKIDTTWHGKFWNPNRQLYVDAVSDGKQSEHVSQLANADAVLFGLAPKALVLGILQHITDPFHVKAQSLDSTTLKLVQPDGPIDYSHDIVQSQAYGMYFVMGALAKSGMSMDAISIIRRLWGPMRDAGNGTFWEQFRQVNGTSCHAWSATPTYILSEVVLGVRPTAPGFGSMVVAPQILDLSWARGAVPTPNGIVNVAWSLSKAKGGDSFRMQLRLPFAAKVRLQIPDWHGRRPARVLLNGRRVSGSPVVTQSGTYEIEAAY
jgi:alpha-L-rhamnosidase